MCAHLPFLSSIQPASVTPGRQDRKSELPQKMNEKGVTQSSRAEEAMGTIIHSAHVCGVSIICQVKTLIAYAFLELLYYGSSHQENWHTHRCKCSHDEWRGKTGLPGDSTGHLTCVWAVREGFLKSDP